MREYLFLHPFTLSVCSYLTVKAKSIRRFSSRLGNGMLMMNKVEAQPLLLLFELPSFRNCLVRPFLAFLRSWFILPGKVPIVIHIPAIHQFMKLSKFSLPLT